MIKAFKETKIGKRIVTPIFYFQNRLKIICVILSAKFIPREAGVAQSI
jgi:hypothetical protein